MIRRMGAALISTNGDAVPMVNGARFPEIHIGDAIAVASETDSIGSWVNSGSVATFESQSAVTNGSPFAFHFADNVTPVSANRGSLALEAIYGLVTGIPYILSVDLRHDGTGDIWQGNLGSSNGGTENLIVSLSNSDTTFQRYTINFVHGATTKFINFRERGAANTGGLYIDNLSLKRK